MRKLFVQLAGVFVIMLFVGCQTASKQSAPAESPTDLKEKAILTYLKQVQSPPHNAQIGCFEQCVDVWTTQAFACNATDTAGTSACLCRAQQAYHNCAAGCLMMRDSVGHPCPTS
jgi:hypothetical protein